MEEYDKRLKGALFKNDKEGNDKRPDYKGNYTDSDGNDFYVSAWVKESKKGDKFMSLSMQPKLDGYKEGSKPHVVKDTDNSNDLPF